MAPATAATRILTIPRSDDGDESFVLANISRDGGKSLDIRLIATEGSGPYVGTIKHDRREKLRAKTYQGDDDEWQIILAKVFWGTSPEIDHAAVALDGLEAIASVREEEEITITIRKNVKGITQRLGNVSLKYDESQEIELFDWSATASRAAVIKEDEIGSFQKKFKQQEKSIERLKQQLEDLIRAKEEHEDALFAKFSELLNTKKLKIRDQQRLLNGAKLDPATVTNVQASRGTAASRGAGSSRAGKRKAGAEDLSGAGAATDSGSEDEGFEKMDVDDGDDEDEGVDKKSEQGKETPDRSDDETTDGESPPLTSTKSPVKQTRGSEQRQEVKRPPSPRDLPFANTRSQGRQEAQQDETTSEKDVRREPDNSTKKGGESGDETEGETDDDEL